MGKVYVDGIELELDDDQQLNGIQAAALAGIDIPHYCWHPGLSVVASCRMCLVEMGRRDPESGETTMLPKLVPACQTPASDGTVFVTNSDKVANARAMVEEDLLLRHPIDCPICDKAGECRLQDYYFQYGQSQRRADLKPFTSRRRSLGDTVTLFVDRCVMCSRCVRFCREVTGSNELMVINRGSHEEIDVFPGFPLENKMSGNVVDLCPVGALGDKDFLYQQRVWFMKSHPHVCDGCSTGCSIYVDENQDRVYRLRPRENMHINSWWMCDEGRYGWKHVHDSSRMINPTRRDGEQCFATTWPEVTEQVDRALREAERPAYVLSPHLTVEEAYLLARYGRELNPEALLVLGHVPVAGKDERFAGGFTIRREKCPNRRGVEQLIGAMAGEVVSWQQFLDRVADEPCDAVWITGGYKTPWNDEATAERLRGVKTLIVQDLFASPVFHAAHWQLPATAFAERAGSFVNYGDRLQSFTWAVRPPQGLMAEAQLFWRLLGEKGLYQADRVREEVARRFVYFSAASKSPPDVGVDLKVNQLV
jgi:NADH-quinone oxidoreductase subunit G